MRRCPILAALLAAEISRALQTARACPELVEGMGGLTSNSRDTAGPVGVRAAESHPCAENAQGWGTRSRNPRRGQRPQKTSEGASVLSPSAKNAPVLFCDARPVSPKADEAAGQVFLAAPSPHDSPNSIFQFGAEWPFRLYTGSVHPDKLGLRNFRRCFCIRYRGSVRLFVLARAEADQHCHAYHDSQCLHVKLPPCKQPPREKVGHVSMIGLYSMPAATGVYPKLAEGLAHSWRVQLPSARRSFQLHFRPVTLTYVEVNLHPETESRLQKLAQQTGRAPRGVGSGRNGRLPERTMGCPRDAGQPL